MADKNKGPLSAAEGWANKGKVLLHRHHIVPRHAGGIDDKSNTKDVYNSQFNLIQEGQ